MSGKRKGKGEKGVPEASVDPQGPESVPGAGATGREMAATEPGRNPHTGLPQGELARYPQGSNGDVHRGPDRYPRRNVVEGLLMRALIREGALLVVDAKGKRRHRAKIPMAMAENFVTRLQLIVLKGTDTNVLRLTAIANDVFKPGKNDKSGHSDGPFPAIFQRPPKTPPPPASASASATPAPGTLLGADGQEYVSA
jgi:hypothetical protein